MKMMLNSWSMFFVVLVVLQVTKVGSDGNLKRSKIVQLEGIHFPNDADEEPTVKTSVTFTRNYGQSKTLDLSISCGKKFMVLHMTSETNFSGMVYPIDSNIHCVGKYENVNGSFTYKIPLTGCNTQTELKETGMEYYNVLILQDRTKLIGPGAKHIGVRCQYPNILQTLHSTFAANFESTGASTTTLYNVSAVPRLYLEVYAGDLTSNVPATEVVVGQNLTLVIGMENYEMYSMKVFNCNVESGMGNSQQLFDFNGCAVNTRIIGPLTYSGDKKFAFVTFKAHKFPASSSVYYRCDVQLCVHTEDECNFSPYTCPRGPPAGSTMNNKEFYQIFKDRNVTQRSYFDIKQKNPRTSDEINYSVPSEGPILGGLTPDMIKEIFYGRQRNMTYISEAVRRTRSVSGKKIQGNVNMYELRLGVQVADKGHKRAQTVTITKVVPKVPNTDSKVCWKEMKVPLLVSSSLTIPVCLCLVLLLVHLHKRILGDNDEEDNAAVNHEMNDMSPAPTESPLETELPAIAPGRSRSLADLTEGAHFNRFPGSEEFPMGPIRARATRRPSLDDVFGQCTKNIAGRKVIVKPSTPEHYRY